MTCVSWFGAAQGGAFTFYPAGALGSREAIPAKHNTAILIDTDSVFHGVERVRESLPDLPPIDPVSRLHFLGDERWALRRDTKTLADYAWSEIRYSVSWKGYCFRDKAEHARWQDHSDDLCLDDIVDTLEGELRRRGVLDGPRPAPDAFASLIVETFIKFPVSG